MSTHIRMLLILLIIEICTWQLRCASACNPFSYPGGAHVPWSRQLPCNPGTGATHRCRTGLCQASKAAVLCVPIKVHVIRVRRAAGAKSNTAAALCITDKTYTTHTILMVPINQPWSPSNRILGTRAGSVQSVTGLVRLRWLHTVLNLLSLLACCHDLCHVHAGQGHLRQLGPHYGGFQVIMELQHVQHHDLHRVG
jgi:hypothetical protein